MGEHISHASRSMLSCLSDVFVEYCPNVVSIEVDIRIFEYMRNLVWVNFQIFNRAGFPSVLQITFQKRFITDFTHGKINDEVQIIFSCLRVC